MRVANNMANRGVDVSGDVKPRNFYKNFQPVALRLWMENGWHHRSRVLKAFSRHRP